jgi:type I restriction enzyme S subunit
MAGEFPTVALGDVAVARSGFAFKSSDWTASGVPVVKIANVKDGRLVMDGCSFVSPEVAATAAEFGLVAGDILIAMTGYIGDVALVRPSDLPAVLNQRVGRFSIRDKRHLERRFLFYLLRSPEIRAAIEGLGYGSAQPNVSPSLIHGVEIPLPRPPEQRAIAHILGALDDKIELNRRMNETLEAIARALFKSWFVDFDPVRAKVEGRDTGLPAELADLFPSEFEDSELREIPKGWRVCGLDEVATFRNGLALQNYPPAGDESLPVLKIAQLRSGTSDGADRAAANIPSDCVVNDGDVLFSWSGSLIVDLWCGGQGALNQHLFKVTSEDFPKWFYYLWTKHHLNGFQDIAADKATTMGHIQRKHLGEAKVCVPSARLLKALDERCAPLIESAILARLESRTLTALRDTLLPKLLSGEIRVGAGAKTMPEAV